MPDLERRLLGRRQFLAQFGVLGASLLVAPTAARADSLTEALTAPRAAAPAPPADPGAALHVLSQDTYRGLAAWVVPGKDPYSVAQGETSPTPGGVEAGAGEFLLYGLDRYVPASDEMLRPVAQALATGVSSTAPAPLPAVPLEAITAVDDELQALFASDRTVPITLVVAMLLNGLAVQVDPASVAGPFPASPYANLSHAGKTEAFRRLEEESPAIAERIDGELAEPMRSAFSGVLGLLGASLPNFAAFAVYSEFAVFDRATRTARERPLGWTLSNFAPGRKTPPNGHAEFRGYHRGLR